MFEGKQLLQSCSAGLDGALRAGVQLNPTLAFRRACVKEVTSVGKSTGHLGEFFPALPIALGALRLYPGSLGACSGGDAAELLRAPRAAHRKIPW